MGALIVSLALVDWLIGAIINIGTQMAKIEEELQRLKDKSETQATLSKKTLAEVIKLREDFDKLKEELENGDLSQEAKDLIAAIDGHLDTTQANLTGSDAVNEDEAAPPS